MPGLQRIAVLVPCYNEAATIGKVVSDFRAQLPHARICVFDNNCTDDTARIAAEHGAEVFYEPRQGKGFVVEAMFERIDADYYIMVDGDDTYCAASVRDLLAPVQRGEADMVVGARLHQFEEKSFRPLHEFGNKLVRNLINRIFDARLSDILSGYRAFNRRFVQDVPIVSAGFEIETEMTIQALYHRCRIVEVQLPYGVRPAGSVSKLSTFRDGFRVLWKLFSLLRALKPLSFFGSAGLVLALLGLAAGSFPVHDYFTEPQHYVRHVPLAILAIGLLLLASGSAFLGVLLHAMNSRFRELHSVLVRDRVRESEHER